jgi:hypothetical protein
MPHPQRPPERRHVGLQLREEVLGPQVDIFHAEAGQLRCGPGFCRGPVLPFDPQHALRDEEGQLTQHDGQHGDECQDEAAALGVLHHQGQRAAPPIEPRATLHKERHRDQQRGHEAGPARAPPAQEQPARPKREQQGHRAEERQEDVHAEEQAHGNREQGELSNIEPIVALCLPQRAAGTDQQEQDQGAVEREQADQGILLHKQASGEVQPHRAACCDAAEDHGNQPGGDQVDCLALAEAVPGEARL